MSVNPLQSIGVTSMFHNSSRSALHRGRRKKRGVTVALVAALLPALVSHAATAATTDRTAVVSPTTATAPVSGAAAVVGRTTPGSSFIYDQDYPFIGYSDTPQHNDIAHLIARIKAGKVKLRYTEPRGYFDSLLKALDIDPDSQSLVFSKTSLQVSAISAETPRAIYFNDNTYVAWIEGSDLIEISTMDSMMGTVFYTIDNRSSGPAQFTRETTLCLTCHDTFSESGGGVPNFLFLSAYSRREHEIITDDVARHTSDATPLADRWGGWYVTGNLGGIAHLGNILPGNGQLPLSAAHPQNFSNLDAFFDTKSYLTDQSDVVALLVLQHQVDVHNLIIRANYKCRMLMEHHQPGSSLEPISWEQLPPLMQSRFQELLEPLVEGMLMVHAAKFPVPIHGHSGFAKSFEARGPWDSRGRSLRDLDLRTRLFKYPLSFLIYSEGFDYLPGAAKEYVYRRLDEILTGRDQSPTFSSLTPAERQAIFQILRATKPDFARAASRETGTTASRN